MSAATHLQPLNKHKLTRLTTYLPDGVTATDELVRIAIDHDRVLLATWEDSATARRLAAHPVADITPCTLRGKTAGSPIRLRAHLLDGAESRRAARLMALRFPFQQRLGAPLSHRLLRRRILYYELRPMDEQHIETMLGCPD